MNGLIATTRIDNKILEDLLLFTFTIPRSVQIYQKTAAGIAAKMAFNVNTVIHF